MHGALKLATLALPLLVVAHRLSCGPLPCCGSGVVVHIVEPAPLVHSLLPAGREGGGGGGGGRVVTLNKIFIKHHGWVVQSKTCTADRDYNQEKIKPAKENRKGDKYGKCTRIME